MRKPDELAGDTGPAPAPQMDARARDMARVQRLATLMDAQFRLPVVGVRVGLDGILGLVPGVGDLLVAGPSAWMIAKGWQHGARKRVLTKMAVNSGIDLLIGSIPLVGDIFDVAFKANLKNARLLQRELGED